MMLDDQNYTYIPYHIGLGWCQCELADESELMAVLFWTWKEINFKESISEIIPGEMNERFRE